MTFKVSEELVAEAKRRIKAGRKMQPIDPDHMMRDKVVAMLNTGELGEAYRGLFLFLKRHSFSKVMAIIDRQVIDLQALELELEIGARAGALGKEWLMEVKTENEIDI